MGDKKWVHSPGGHRSQACRGALVSLGDPAGRGGGSGSPRRGRSECGSGPSQTLAPGPAPDIPAPRSVSLSPSLHEDRWHPEAQGGPIHREREVTGAPQQALSSSQHPTQSMSSGDWRPLISCPHSGLTLVEAQGKSLKLERRWTDHSPGSQEFPVVQEVLAPLGVPRNRQPGSEEMVAKHMVKSRVPAGVSRG